MRPRRIGSFVTAWLAGSVPARVNTVGRTVALLAGTCTTTKTAAGRSSGRFRTISMSVSTPPAEAPMTMMSWVCTGNALVEGQKERIRDEPRPLIGGRRTNDSTPYRRWPIRANAGTASAASSGGRKRQHAPLVGGLAREEAGAGEFQRLIPIDDRRAPVAGVGEEIFDRAAVARHRDRFRAVVVLVDE